MTGEILILTAVELEAKAIARRLSLKHTGRGVWQAGVVTLVNIGIAGAHADRIAGPAKRWIAAGIGGALDPRLKIGSVVLDDPAGVLAQLDLPVTRGPIHTAAAIVESPATKAALFSQTGALAVDMETQILRAKAAAAGATLIAIRGISDEATEPLDPVFARIVDDEGRPRVWAIAKELTKRPALGHELRVLGKKAAQAADRMAEVVTAICRHWGAQDEPAQDR